MPTKTVEKLAIREYTPSDKDEVLALHKLGLEYVGAWLGRGPWDEDMNRIEEAYLRHGVFLVGESNGRIVAMGALQRVSDYTYEIKRMRVHPDFQRRGYGQRILNLLEKRAKDLDCKKIILDTSIRQTAAQAMYSKNGYRETGRKDIEVNGIKTQLIYYEKEIGQQPQS